MANLKLTGETTQTLVLDVPQDTREALADQGVEDVPETVTLELREATLREREKFEVLEKSGAFAGPDRYEHYAQLLARRSDAPITVLRELVRDMTTPILTALVTAYVTGEMPDPKAVAGLLRQTQTGLMNRMMLELAGLAPFSAPSTDSGPGTLDGSPPVSSVS